MEIPELIFIGFCSLAIINAIFFLAYLFIGKNKKNISCAILSVFLLFVVLRVIRILLHDLQEDFNLLIGIDKFPSLTTIYALIGPLLLMFLRSVTIRNFRIRAKHFGHFIPFIILFIFDFIANRYAHEKLSNNLYYNLYCIYITFILLHLLYYLALSYVSTFNAVKKSKKGDIPNDIIYHHKVIMVKVISVTWIIFAAYCLQIYTMTYLSVRFFEILYFSLLIYLLIYLELSGKKITLICNSKEKYKTSYLANEESVVYKSRLVKLIEQDQLYLDHDLTIAKFAKEASLSIHVVSQIVNEQIGCNFNDFVNYYRINKAKGLLKDPNYTRFTIATIAHECGFNTLSAFNSAFKKFSGKTPSQYRLD